MPTNELGEHQQLGGLPPSLTGCQPVWCVRYTGEIFTDYEAYLQQLHQYRQRVWRCKYTGASGLTYEEAILSEQRVGQVVKQFPALYEREAIQLVHHSLEAAEQLCSTILSHLASHYVEGEQLLGTQEDGTTAPCVVREVQLPHSSPGGHENGTAGGEGGAGGQDSDATEDEGEEGGAEGRQQQRPRQAADPEAVVYVVEWLGEGGAPSGTRASLRRVQLQRPGDSPLAALTPQLLGQWVEAVASAEPVAGVAGISCLWRVADYWRERHGLPEQLPPEMAERLRPARQKALQKVPSVAQAVGGASDDEAGGDDDEAEEYDPAEEVAEMYEEAAAESDFSDDDYRPMQPAVEARFKPLPARGRGRGRGRGRWGGRGGGAYAVEAEANPAAAAFAAAAVAAAGGGYGMGQPQLLSSGSMSGQLDALDGPPRQAPLDQQKQELRRVGSEAKPKPERNNFKCPKCHRAAHVEGSPLLLCDTCPRSYHQACLALADVELPSGDWCCPKCRDSSAAAMRRVMDAESRRAAANERAAARERAAEDKARRAAAARDERKRPDDWEVLEEEKENVQRLEIRLIELQELLGRVEGQAGEGGGGAAPAFCAAEADDLRLRIAEAGEALGRLRRMVEGPPAQYREVVSGEHAQAVLWQGLVAAEFLHLYGAACEARPMGLQELFISLAWPLDNPELAKLLQQLLLCCLLELINHEPPERSRAKRWARVLSDATWPEVCRRYLLSTRAGKATLPEGESVEVMLLSDDQAALHVAHLLDAEPWHRLPATALLRLVNILCYDIAQGVALRNDINARLQNIGRITTERYREHTAERRAKREGDWGPPYGGGRKRGGRGGRGRGASSKAAEPTEEELQQMAEEVEAEAMEEEGDAEAARFRLQRELQYDAQLEATAMRTEPLGLDRHCRRYWWLHSDPGFLFVEDADGRRISALTTKEQLDGLMAALNRRGPRERSLHHALRKKYAAICARLAVESRASYGLEGIPRPPPLDPRTPQPSEEELAARLGEAAVEETRDKLDAFLEETARVDVELEGRLPHFRASLPACADAAALRAWMLELELLYCHAGEGLPRDADESTMAALLGEAPPPQAGGPEERDDAQGGTSGDGAAVAPHVKAEPAGEGEGEGAGAAPMDVDGEQRQGAKKEEGEEGRLDGAPVGGPRLHAASSSAALHSQDAASEEAARQAGAAQPPAVAQQAAAGLPPRAQPAARPGSGSGSAAKPPLHPSVARLAKADSLQPSSAGVSQSGGEAGGTETEAGTTVDQEGPQQLRPVLFDDDMDDSDAEHAYLREKRMRRPARLWRTARERAVWLRMTRDARSADQTAYAAYIMCDRAGPMLQRVVQLREEIAKWEAEEKERQRLEEMRAKRQAAGVPSLRPLMIRTGKAKTDDGVRIVLKAMGKEPFGSGRSSTFDTIASDEQIAECRWGYQCSVCLLAGDLLCCEHPDGCVVSVHPECTGKAFPSGPYICMNHDSRELKTRIRRRASSALAAVDSEETEGEEEEGGSGGGGGSGARGAAAAAEVDSEATLSEETDSDSATEDEGASSKRKRKR